MRWLVVLLLLVPMAGATEFRPPLEAALGTLQPSGSPYLVEALVAAGIDPAAWPAEEPILGRVTVSGPPGIGPLREIYALASAGVRIHDDPYVGEVDLLEMLQENGGMDSENDALHSFTILSYNALGEPVPLEWVAKLVSLANNGTWGCGPGTSMACTGYALTALATQDAVDQDMKVAARELVAAFYADGPGANAQPVAWAINVQRALGDEVRQGAWDALFATQASDGRFLFGGQPNDWATHEAIVAMTSGHPIVAGEPRGMPEPADAEEASGLAWLPLAMVLFVAVAFRRR